MHSTTEYCTDLSDAVGVHDLILTYTRKGPIYGLFHEWLAQNGDKALTSR